MKPMLTNRILLGNSPEVLSRLEPNIASLVVTSPPYKRSDGFSFELIRDTFIELFRVQRKNSLFFLNFGHLAEDKMRPFQVANLACDCGYQLNETFTWVKNHFRPIQGSKRVNNLTEFVFLLYKGKMPSLDRLAIGVPYADISNAKRFNNGRNIRCRGNIWYIPYQTINSIAEKLHNDRFPVQLPEMCIKLAGISKGSLVIDPFVGSGSSLVAAKNLGMSYLGIDKDPHWLEVSRKRLNAIPVIQTEMF